VLRPPMPSARGPSADGLAASGFGRAALVATIPTMKKLLLLIVLAALATLAAKKVRSV